MEVLRENKVEFLKLRLTASEKENFKNWCAAHDYTISEGARALILEATTFKKNSKKSGKK